jgi:membrane protease subunit HflC
MTSDCFIVWEISDPFVFYQRLRTVSNAEVRINDITYNALQTIISRMEQSDIVGSEEDSEDYMADDRELETNGEDQPGGLSSAHGDSSSIDERSRELLNIAVTQTAQESVDADGLGIRIIDVKIKSFELPHDNEQAVFQRMISERDRYARFERAQGEREANFIRNAVDRQANITVSDARAEAERIRANGEAEYMRLLAIAYSGFDPSNPASRPSPEREEFFRFMRGLDAVKASLDGNDKTVILDRDSALARILAGP